MTNTERAKPSLSLANSRNYGRVSFAELFRYLAGRGEFGSTDLEAELSRSVGRYQPRNALRTHPSRWTGHRGPAEPGTGRRLRTDLWRSYRAQVRRADNSRGARR